MSSLNPIERNPVTRFLLGLAVFVAMSLGGGVGGSLLAESGLPYGDAVGVVLGGFVVFAVFAVGYTRYDASVRPE